MRKQELHPRTESINKTQKNHSKRARSEALIWLTNRFPEAFDNTTRIRPLKVGIMQDILAYSDEAATAGISKSKLREAVVLFTRRVDYLACLKAKESRIDLNGQYVADVTAEEADHAATKIKKRVEKSVKNARKILAAKAMIPPVAHTPSETNKFRASTPAKPDTPFPIYPGRAAYHETPAEKPAKATVVIKNKMTRNFDPSAVARLKEKLGLQRSLEEEKV